MALVSAKVIVRKKLVDTGEMKYTPGFTSTYYLRYQPFLSFQDLLYYMNFMTVVLMFSGCYRDVSVSSLPFHSIPGANGSRYCVRFRSVYCH